MNGNGGLQVRVPSCSTSRRRPAALVLRRVFVALWFLGSGATGAAEQESAVFESCNYANEALARAAWQPMTGSAVPGHVEEAGRQVLRLPCRFAGQSIERASWDHTVQLDLSACRGIRFQLLCPDPSPVASFSLYLQSGSGWYSTSFYPDLPGWNTIVIDKASMRVEGQPDGWGTIRTIRLSAWRGGDTRHRVARARLRLPWPAGSGCHGGDSPG